MLVFLGMVCRVVLSGESPAVGVSRVCLCCGGGCVCLCVSRTDGVGEVGPKETTLAAVESVACSPPPAVNSISEEKYRLCRFYKAGLCLCPASELSTILEIVSSLLKRFQTMTVAPVRFPFNGLASSPILRTWASSESKDLPVGVYLPLWSQSFKTPSRFSLCPLVPIN